MERINVYHRKDGRWEGRISRGKRKDGRRKYQYILARTREDVIEKMAEIRRNEQPTGKCHKTVERFSMNGSAVCSILSRNPLLPTML